MTQGGSAPGPESDHGALGQEPEGATPLDDEDLDGLIPDFVATRGDLNLVEFENIARALPWAHDQARQGGPKAVLRHSFIFDVHKRMFGDVWRWAGTQRRRGTNIGVEPYLIAERVTQAVGDAVWWHDNSVYGSDELAIRLHHRLVVVHPFPNGNGRCTRLMADLYLASIKARGFDWGGGAQLEAEGTVRQAYLDALRAADRDDFEPLITFARR